MLKYILATCTVLAFGVSNLEAISAHAQADVQDTVIVTGSRISRGGQGGGYNVYKRISADFMLVDIYYQSGTRDEAIRANELRTMFNRLVAADKANESIFLQGGSDYGRVPIETILFDEILEDSYDSEDINLFSLTLGIEVNGETNFDKVLARGQAFLDAIPLSGRAEAYLDDTQYIGARNIKAHRPEILRGIAEEAAKLREIFGPSDIYIDGFESKLETATTGPLQLDVYLPYSISLTTKQ